MRVGACADERRDEIHVCVRERGAGSDFLGVGGAGDLVDLYFVTILR